MRTPTPAQFSTRKQGPRPQAALSLCWLSITKEMHNVTSKLVLARMSPRRAQVLTLALSAPDNANEPMMKKRRTRTGAAGTAGS